VATVRGTSRTLLTRVRMSDSMANWLSRPKLRRASEYLLAVASLGLAFVAAGTFLRWR